MRIKRFVATDMRSALHMVRDDQGPHAVILSSRKLETGQIEVVAATDYDEALVQQALRAEAPVVRQDQPTQPPIDIRTAEQPNHTPPLLRPRANVAVDPATRAWTEDPALAEVKRELAGMRDMIERQIGRFAEERLRGVQVRAQALDELAEYGVDHNLSRSIAAAIPADAERGRARGMMLGLLAKSLVVPRRDPLEEGGAIALIGPTGVGKTTTIAKLASRYASAHSARDVALVTTDTYRVGGREQLYTYGRLLGMPVVEARPEDGLADILDRLSDYKLVLIDTPGMGQRDKALAAQFSWLRAARRVRTFLTLPANAQSNDIDEVVRRFRNAEPEGTILTKLDETGCLGAALSVLIRHRLPVAYVTDGQRVPEDLHRAEAHRLVLRLGELRRAADLTDSQETAHAVA
jgi:flagellar biosynthesis protein FlhF